MGIGASVGRGGRNDLADVLVVQHLLNDWLTSTGQPAIGTDGYCGPGTIAAIMAYQAKVVPLPNPDGLISPGGKTWNALASGQGVQKPLSGAKWWHANQAKYPNSASLNDLAKPFRDAAIAFVNAMRAGGARVEISSTLRNPTRAHLMHYSWKIAKGAIAPDKVPVRLGLPIQWDHGDLARSKKGAQEMVDLFAIAYEPSLTSNHTLGRAADMTISWEGTIQVEDAKGNKHALAAPRNGKDNAKLHAVGATYGVLKLVSDPPHWSDNGR